MDNVQYGVNTKPGITECRTLLADDLITFKNEVVVEKSIAIPNSVYISKT